MIIHKIRAHLLPCLLYPSTVAKIKKNIKKQKIKFEHLWKIGDERNVEGHELHRSGDNKSSPGDLTKNQSKHYIHGTFEIGFRSK